MQARAAARRARHAAAMRARRQDPAVRAREAEERLPEFSGADARFKRDFLDRSFGHSCTVYDRLWFDNNLTTMASIRIDMSRANATAVLQREFSNDVFK
ncbi:uncharacterized protein LOC144173706 [Haemaphysalis longicornis]